MTTQEAYDFQIDRLTPEQKIQVTVKEHNIDRALAPWEIVQLFNLTPYNELRKPRERRFSEEVENQNWSEQ